MAEIFPFKAWMYNTAKVGELEKVLTQPYDKISPEMQARYHDLHPHNLVRVIKGKTTRNDDATNNVYSRAKNFLREWIDQRILVESNTPAIYAYGQEYEIPGSPGEKRTRKGFIALGRVVDYTAGIVFPHEQTLSAPKQDRLELLRQTRTHCECIFMLYSDPTHRIDQILEETAQRPAGVRVVDEFGTVHSLWAITNEGRIQRIVEAMRNKKLIIADGHHRYETALNYRNERRAKERAPQEPVRPYDQTMMTFVNTERAGLTILPTHRVISNLVSFDLKKFLVDAQQYFHLKGFKFFTPEEKHQRREEFRRELTEVGQVFKTVGLYATGTSNFYLLRLKSDLNWSALLSGVSERQRSLDVVILHKILLEKCLGITEAQVRAEQHIQYLREFDKGMERVDRGEAQLCFFLNPTPLEQVRDLALAGERLPQKSTDFYPKLLSGLTMYRVD